MRNMSKILISALWITICLITGVSAEMQQVSTQDAEKMPQNIDITDVCKKDQEFIKGIQSATICQGKEFACVDGWSATHYFDGRLFTEDIQSSKDAPLAVTHSKEKLEELKNATVGIKSTSSCNCITPISYTVRRSQKKEEVSCEEFYKFIEEYNSNCNGCVKKTGEGCC